MTDLLEIVSLGGLHIRRNGQLVTGLASRKAEALLLYLAYTGRTHAREVLAELLWDERSQSRALANLRVLLTSLRQHLDPYLIITRQTVALDPQHPIWLDALEVERSLSLSGESSGEGALSPAGAEQLEKGLALYRGNFLEGFYVREGRGFEEWAAMQRETLLHLVLDGLQQLVTFYLERGDYPPAVAHARRLLQLDPLQERAHRDLMRALLYSGQRSAALSQYENCCTILQEELGVEPSEETTLLYHQIRSGTIEMPDREEAPALAIPFVGREEEHQWLVEQWNALRRGTNRLTLIEGEAGMGKSRLVEEVLRYTAGAGARLLSGRCYEFGMELPYQPLVEILRKALQNLGTAPLPEIWQVELSRLLPELNEQNPHLPPPTRMEEAAARQRLFEAVARLLRARPPAEEEARPTVLFLDDLQWADQATVDLLRYLLQRLQDAPIWFLGTYRREEMELDHPFLLLRRHLGREGRLALLRLHPLSEEAIRQALARLPMRTEQQARQLAAYLNRESTGNPFILSQLLQQLSDQGSLRLEGGSWHLEGEPLIRGGNDPPVPFGVREMILGRVGHLSAPARELLYLAATIGQSFEQSLLHEASESQSGVGEQLTECLHRRLVTVERRAGASPAGSHPDLVYDFSHDMIRQTVYEALSSRQRRELHRRVATALERLHGEQVEELVDRLAYHYGRSSERSRALFYLQRAAQHATERYAWENAIRLYSQAIALLPPEEELLRFTLLSQRERAYNMAAMREEQATDLAKLEQLARRTGKPARLAEILCHRVEWCLRTGRFQEGTEQAERTVEQARGAERPDLVAEALRQGALCWINLGDIARARRWGEEALALYTEIGAQRGRVLTLGNLGIIALTEGALPEAQQYMEESVQRWRALGDPLYLAACLNNLSQLYLDMGELARALACQLEARELVPQTGNRDLDAHSLTSLGIIYDALGQYEQASAAFEASLHLAREAADKKIECFTLLKKGNTLLARGDREAAERCYRASLALQLALEIPVFRPETAAGLASCLLARGEPEQAATTLAEVEALAEAHGGLELARLLVVGAEIAIAMGDTALVQQKIERLLTLVEGNHRGELNSPALWFRVARALRLVGVHEESHRLEQEAERLREEQADQLTDPELRQSYLARHRKLS